MSKIMQVTDIKPDWAGGKATLTLLETNFNGGKKFIYDASGPQADFYVSDTQLQTIQDRQNRVHETLKSYETDRTGTGATDNIRHLISVQSYGIADNFTALQNAYKPILNSEIEAYVDENSPVLDMALLTKIINNEQNFVARREEIHKILDLMRFVILEEYAVTGTIFTQTVTNTSNTSITYTHDDDYFYKDSTINANFKTYSGGLLVNNYDAYQGFTNQTLFYDAYALSSINIEFSSGFTNITPEFTDLITLLGMMTAIGFTGNNCGLVLNLLGTKYPKTVTAGSLTEYITKDKYELTLDYVFSFQV